MLGLILQSNRHNTHTIDKLSLSVQQTARMLARVLAQRTGMREYDLLCLVNAFVVSRLTNLAHALDSLCGRSRCAVTVYVILEGYRSVYRELLGKLIPKLWVELRFVIAVSWRRLAVLRHKRSLEKTCSC
ncbi:hypothetical protein HPB50_022432 [Hyalomma asiaticum]|uniref:Uncharacterized protein n=1 Tax=Hyalomma asiaticum TaxID=266040 RepID=A0ACB7TLQ6_HYAAI|nr:hypothetical protein HPB50_022432 [Hyalomma asiaticum]